MAKALLVIDLQNDYFDGGLYPLDNTKVTLENCCSAIKSALENNNPVIIIQHIADKSKGTAPFFNEGTEGAQINQEILSVLPNPTVVIKRHADSFLNTSLATELESRGVDELIICGMMTQNCVTHTAISRSAESYKVSVLADCCTTIDPMTHGIALNALADRVGLIQSVTDWL